jgi:hypothetical protein
LISTKTRVCVHRQEDGMSMRSSNGSPPGGVARVTASISGIAAWVSAA